MGWLNPSNEVREYIDEHEDFGIFVDKCFDEFNVLDVAEKAYSIPDYLVGDNANASGEIVFRRSGSNINLSFGAPYSK